MRPEEREPFELPVTAPLAPPPDFSARLGALGVTLDDAAVAKLGDFLGRLVAMNERMNLTAIVDPEAAWERHALDALSLVPLLADVPAGASLLDVGSGGGVPGLPLAIARPDLAVTLVEATQKKAVFLADVAEALGLANVTVYAERAEELARSFGGRFDVVTARAVAKLAALVPLTAPFARAGGRLLLIKGQRAEEELTAAKRALRASRVTHQKTVSTPTGRIVVLVRG